MELKKYINSVMDFPKKDINFKDITPLIRDPKAFQFAIDELQKEIKKEKIEYDYVVGLDARGFIFGTPLALAERKGFVPVRKANKLPRETIEKEITTEYSVDKLAIHKHDLKPGDRVIIIDDLLATGGSMEAVIEILEEMKVIIKHIYIIIELEDLKGKERMGKYPVTSLVKY
jgi:adenine phosphoribosyltransferase